MNKNQRALIISAVAMVAVSPFVIRTFEKYPIGSPPSGDDGLGGENAINGLLPRDKQTRAPDFNIVDASTGKMVRLHDPNSKKPVLFSFWATWCGPCQQELPRVEELYKKYGNKIDFYGVNSDDDKEHIVSFAKENNLTFPMLADTSRTAQTTYAVSSIPQMYIVDASGKIVYVENGYDPDALDALPSILDKVAAGTL